MGYAGNLEPSYIIPSLIANATNTGTDFVKSSGIEDLDFYIGLINLLFTLINSYQILFFYYIQGDEALAHSTSHQINYPIKHGMKVVGLGNMYVTSFVFYVT